MRMLCWPRSSVPLLSAHKWPVGLKVAGLNLYPGATLRLSSGGRERRQRREAPIVPRSER